VTATPAAGAASDQLLAKTAGGAGWVIGFRFTTRLLGIASTLTLVRLLGPGDFGLVALASSFAQTVDTIANLSPHEAVIRERAPDRAMYDTAFTMSFLRGLLTAAVIAAGAVPAAAFFHEPRMVPVLLALALATLIGSAENIACVDFMRNFAFHKEFQLWTAPRVLQVIATISFALIWPTYWALVFGILTAKIARTALSYAMRPYLPRPTLVAWRRITGFTVWSWAIYMVGMLRDQVGTVLVGRFFSAAAVGVYALGGEIASLPTSELVEPLCRACFPSFSQLRHSGMGVAQTYLRLLGATALLVLPAGVGIAMVADPLVRLAFGPKWLAAIPIIQVLGISATISALGSISATLFSAYAMLRTTFSILLAGGLARVLLLAALLPGGSLLTAALVGMAVATCEQAATIGIAMVRFRVRPDELARAIWRSVLGAAVMGGVLVWLGLGLVPAAEAPWRDLLGATVAGMAVYVAATGLAWVAVGRPDGPERDLLALAGGVARRLRAWPRRRRPGLAVVAPRGGS
jgi:O-antigen/teichoic acid export membrane protein